MDIVANLADPLHSALALFEPRRVPWQVDVDLRAETLEVEPLACCIGRANQPNIAVLDGRLDLLARSRAAICSALNERGRSTGIERDRLVRKGCAKCFEHPFRSRSILAENDRAVASPANPLAQIMQDHLDLRVDVRPAHHRGKISFDLTKKLDLLRIGRRFVLRTVLRRQSRPRECRRRRCDRADGARFQGRPSPTIRCAAAGLS